MSSQIFKCKVPPELLFTLLENVSTKSSNNKYYIYNNNSYKKGIFNKNIASFIEECKPYYHLSKHKYLERKMTYNNFTTVLRQICKHNNIVFTSQILYDKSKYEIIYYIFIT